MPAQLSATEITGLVIDSVVTLLSDPIAGFNVGVASCVAAAKLNTTFKPIDFDHPGRGNFFRMELTEQTIGVLSSVVYPAMCVYTFDFINRNIQKPEKFSGNTRVCIDVWESWKTNAVPDVDATGRILDSIIVDILNRAYSQNYFLNPMVYDGNINGRKGTPTATGDYWRRKTAYGILVEVHQSE